MSSREEPSVCGGSRRTTVLGRLQASLLPYWATVVLGVLTCSHLLSSRFGCSRARLCMWGCWEQQGQCSPRALEMSSWAEGALPRQRRLGLPLPTRCSSCTLTAWPSCRDPPGVGEAGVLVEETTEQACLLATFPKRETEKKG